jgi:hypothetical protein
MATLRGAKKNSRSFLRRSGRLSSLSRARALLESRFEFEEDRRDGLSEFYGQATKGVRWMPWRQKTMKDVASCDKPR